MRQALIFCAAFFIRDSAHKIQTGDNTPREFRHSRPFIVTARDCDVTSSVRLPSHPAGLDAERASMLSLLSAWEILVNMKISSPVLSRAASLLVAILATPLLHARFNF
jgi:hypothetical protein